MLRVFSGLTQIAVINSGALKSGSGRKERKKKEREKGLLRVLSSGFYIFL
jgi:hypothetical protein